MKVISLLHNCHLRGVYVYVCLRFGVQAELGVFFPLIALRPLELVIDPQKREVRL
jgi:hypothetical protein